MVPSQPRPHDNATLFALRFMLSSAFLGLSIKWLTTLPAFSWKIWKILAYFGACAVIAMSYSGAPDIIKWMGNLHPFHLRCSCETHTWLFLWALEREGISLAGLSTWR